MGRGHAGGRSRARGSLRGARSPKKARRPAMPLSGLARIRARIFRALGSRRPSAILVRSTRRAVYGLSSKRSIRNTSDEGDQERAAVERPGFVAHALARALAELFRPLP